MHEEIDAISELMKDYRCRIRKIIWTLRDIEWTIKLSNGGGFNKLNNRIVNLKAGIDSMLIIYNDLKRRRCIMKKI